MAYESPLFQSAMELLGHAISHYNGKDALDRKLVILHLANAVELLLKDVLLESGHSIYNSRKITISVSDALKMLNSDDDIYIPPTNKIELLIDERNALQHRFGSPDELTTIFYMNITLEFFRAILKEHYGQILDSILENFANKKDLALFLLGEKSSEDEFENLKKLARAHPLGALLAASTYLEQIVGKFIKRITSDNAVYISPLFFRDPHRYLRRYGINIPDDLIKQMDNLRILKVAATREGVKLKSRDVIEVISAIEKFENLLSDIQISDAQTLIEKLERDSIRRKASIHEKRLRYKSALAEASVDQQATNE